MEKALKDKETLMKRNTESQRTLSMTFKEIKSEKAAVEAESESSKTRLQSLINLLRKKKERVPSLKLFSLKHNKRKR